MKSIDDCVRYRDSTVIGGNVLTTMPRSTLEADTLSGLATFKRNREAGQLYFTQLKCTGTLFDNFCSGEVTLSCTHSSTVLRGFPNFHLWLTALTPESESLR